MEQRERAHVAQRLAEIGFAGRDLYSLEKDPEVLARVAPCLLELLEEVDSPRVKTDVVRVLSEAPIPPQPLVAELRRIGPEAGALKAPKDLARLSGDDLVAELRRIRSQSTGAEALASALANALAKRADESVFSDLVEIIRDQRYGRARQSLPYALGRVASRREDTIRILAELLGDDDLTAQAIDVLAALDAVEVLPAIMPFLESERQLVKREAGRAVMKLSGRPVTPQAEDKGPAAGDLVETSANFDAAEVPMLLQQLADRVEGINPSDIELLEIQLADMEVGEERSFSFRLAQAGQDRPLCLRVFMSDPEAPDVIFLSSPELIEAIDELIDSLD